MGFLDKMKNVFFEEEEGGKKVPQENQAPAPAPSYQAPGQQDLPEQVIAVKADPQPSNVSQGAAQPTGEGKVNADLLKKLESALKEFNLPGPDYLELKAIMDNANFRKNIPDETQRIMSAFFSIQAGNPSFSKQVVIDSIKEYVSRLEKERQNGLQQLSQRVEECINGPQKSIDEKRDRIQKLQAEIERIQGEISAIEQSIEQNRTELYGKKLDFDKTFDAIIGALNADMVKIDSIIN